MDMKKYGTKRFYKLDDVQERARRETTEDVSEGGYGKPVLTFRSGRRFSLNTTNNDIMRAAFGDESNDWLGREIELYAGETKYNGDLRATVLIRPISPALKPDERTEPAPKPPKADFDDDIAF